MSGRRGIWAPGYPVTATDLQRLADAAASAGDAQLSALVNTGGKTGSSGMANDRMVVPLQPRILDEAFGDPARSAGGTPLVGVYAGTTRFSLYPCLLIVRGVGTALVPDLVAQHSGSPTAAPALASNATGSTRTDLLYATIQRTVSVTGARKIKNPSGGAITTQTVDLASDATVTLGIVTGSTTLPADSASAWNIPLALLDLPNGYVSESNVLTTGMIRPCWPRGWIDPKLVRAFGRASLNEATPPAAPYTAIPQQWGSLVQIGVVFRHTAAAQTKTLDSFRDWRNRAVRISLLRPSALTGTYPPPHAVAGNDNSANRSIETKMQFTGTAGVFFDSAGSPMQFTFSVDGTTGELKLTITPAPTDATNGDNYFIWVEGTDQFVAG